MKRYQITFGYRKPNEKYYYKTYHFEVVAKTIEMAIAQSVIDLIKEEGFLPIIDRIEYKEIIRRNKNERV